MKNFIRKIEYFFENMYWYEWRKIKINDSNPRSALEIMNDSYNGDTSIIASLIVKTTHMLHSVRKYSLEQDRYVFTNEILNMKDEKVREEIINCVLKEKDKTKSIYFFAYKVQEDTSFEYKGVMKENDFLVYEVRPVQKGFLYQAGEGEDILSNLKKVPNYIYPINKNNTKLILKIEDFIYDYSHFEEVSNKIKEYIKNTYGSSISKEAYYLDNANGVIEIKAKTYTLLDEEMKKKVRGRIIAYHTLWQYRKELNKFYDYDPICDSNSDYKRKKDEKWDSLNNIFKEYASSWWY